MGTEAARERIEATFLEPQAENFVETPQVVDLKDRIKFWLSLGYPVHIIGPTGCGKTTLAMKVAQELERPMVWINGDEAMTTADLIGGYSEISYESLRDQFIHNVLKARDIVRPEWVDNPLTLACKYGYTLIYNEFSRSMPAANNVLLSVLEEGVLELPTKFGEERYIKVHPDFRAIFTSNSIEYAGVHRPQDALLDRMVSVYMDYYDFDTEVEIVKAHTGLPDGLARRAVAIIRKLREKLPDPEKPGTRACIMIGQGLAAVGAEGKKVLEGICIDVLGTKVRGPADLKEKRRLIRGVLNELS